MSRSFAHVGVPPVYVGELVLALVLVASPAALLRPWMGSLWRGGALTGVAWGLFLFLGYGIAQGLRGLGEGHDVLATAKNTVFHIYPLFFFPGVWVGLRHPDLLRRIWRPLAWCIGLYGVAYLTVLASSGLTAELEPTEVAWLGQPYGAGIILLGLLAFEHRPGRVWLPLLLNTLVWVGLQVRAAWLSATLALVLWGVLAGRARRVFGLGALVASVLVVGVVTDARLPAPPTRGGEISTRDIVARAVAAASPRAAAALTPHAQQYVGTVAWRLEWWAGIWRMVHQDAEHVLLGPGYGFDIWGLHPDSLGTEPRLRTPHNVFVYALGYTGWVGVACFLLLQLAIGLLLWRVYRRTGQPFGVCFWSMILAWSAFDNFLEAPFGAIPSYLLLGLAAASGDAAMRTGAEPTQRGDRR